MTTLNTQNLMDQINAMGSTDPYVKVLPTEYTPKTMAYARDREILPRIKATLDALNSYEDNGQSIKDNPLVSPMAKRVRNGFQVKVGYGSRNEGLIEFINSDGQGVSQIFCVHRGDNSIRGDCARICCIWRIG